ncbi:MAG TPA: D-alanyl-D-alanine carboxypeptidase family protein [Pyrinomonadaceae bacterium]|nr:D-alanyl-D-alanine carboxypeptidase family protein [Pyrinomonadaceae bacterium]
MAVNIKKLIFNFVLALIILAAVFILSGCIPHEAGQNISGGSKNSGIRKLAAGQTNNKANSNNRANSSVNPVNLNIDPNSSFAEAARKNAETEKNLRWLFGKKPQTGWYLYKPLISKEIGLEPEAAPTEFAEALAGWQKSAKLQPTGILDELTMFAFLSEWQKYRLFRRGYPPEQVLIIAPPDDFYDPSRDAELRQIERETYDAYKRMVKAAAADPSLKLKTDGGELAPTENFLKIISSFRTKQYQQKLRAASPNSGSAGLAVNSPHFTGRALDIYVGGEPVSTADANRAIQINTPIYLWMVKNAGKFGFRPYFYEPWHWEYVPD